MKSKNFVQLKMEMRTNELCVTVSIGMRNFKWGEKENGDAEQ